MLKDCLVEKDVPLSFAVPPFGSMTTDVPYGKFAYSLLQSS